LRPELAEINTWRLTRGPSYEGLWGGELPAFDTVDEANELIGALVMGLWNRLTRHQERSSPFRLLRMEAAPKRASLAALAQMRRQELDGFIEGLFGHEEMIDLPERAHRGLDDLGQMRAMFNAAAVITENEAKPVADKGMETTLQHLREMARIAEHEIHAVVLACARARRQMLAGMPTSKPTVH
jgi:hypothetical protein